MHTLACRVFTLGVVFTVYIHGAKFLHMHANNFSLVKYVRIYTLPFPSQVTTVESCIFSLNGGSKKKCDLVI